MIVKKTVAYFLCLLVVLGYLQAQVKTPGVVSLRSEYSKTLMELVERLRELQLSKDHGSNSGAIRCEHCNVLHTRAAEAVYPFSIAWKIARDSSYLRAAVAVGNWLIRQQEENGSWKETPEEWTGTTTDQLLMLELSYEQIADKLSQTEREDWRKAIEKAADYLSEVMSPEFASINYCATTASSLAVAHRVVSKNIYSKKARELAHRTIAKMDDDGFINGEGGRSYQNKYGVDLGYDMEMSLWGLGLYAKLTKDDFVDSHVKKSLRNHLFFIYPDGSMDGSWGIRSNKWTTYGGATSDGCQVLFTLYADDDPSYVTASIRNLEFLRKNIENGFVGYGPHYWKLFDKPPCIYPTFAKAKNLALAYELEKNERRPTALLPTEKVGWIKRFKTLDVVEVRTKNFLSTVTAYRYKDISGGVKSKYMYRPSGGAISNLWLKDHGFLQASSQTEYSRPEPMHFPEVGQIKSLTPRIEFADPNGYFTNLFEYDAILDTRIFGGNRFEVTTLGELKDKKWLHGGVGYKMSYVFSDYSLKKSITLYYRDAKPVITIVEPFIHYDGMTFEKVDSKTVSIRSKNAKVKFSILSGEVDLLVGREMEKYWSPYPALRAFPIELVVKPPDQGFQQTVVYEISVVL